MSSQEFFSIIVDTGLGKIIKAQAFNSNLTLTKMAVGDSEEPITQSQTSMLNQRHKFNINSLTQSEQDPNILIAEGVIPSNVGGFYIHQVAVYDDDDELFAIAKVPATYKPNLTQGSSKDITIKFQMQIDNATNITLKVDNSITLATRDFVMTELAKKRDKTDSYSMTQSDERFLGIRAKAVDSDLLDGKDSSLFVLKAELSSLAPRPDLSPYLLRSDTTESPISHKVPKYNSSSELQASKFKMGASSTSMSSSYYPAFVDNNGYIQKASISSFLSAIGVYSKSEGDTRYLNSVPAGMILAFAGNSSNKPSGFLLCDGSAISRSTYSNLFRAIGTTYGVGNGSSTFNLPDFRGCFLRGLGGNAAALGTKQTDAIRNITGKIRTGVRKTDNHGDDTTGAFSTTSIGRNAGAYASDYTNTKSYEDRTFDASRVVPTANENRPLNFAINWLIKY